MSRAFSTIRPIFRERGKINAEVTGRLTESLGGVRVMKGYHAEEREEKVFASGVRRLLDNVMRTLTATSLMSLSASVLLGVVGAATMYIGGRQMLAHTLTPGQLFLLQLSACISDRADHADGVDRDATHRGAGGPGAHAGIHARAARGPGSETRHGNCPTLRARSNSIT